MKKIIYETNYEKLAKIINIENIPDYIKLTSSGFMDLVIEKIEKDIYSMAHYYKQNGDLIPDPDMVIKIYPEQKIIEALSYQDTYSYQEVYYNKDLVNLKLKKELNNFLSQWLTNLINQRFKQKGD